MGGATMIKVAHELREFTRGILLLATQSAETQKIKDLSIPIMFIHGTNDTSLNYFANTVSLYQEYKGEKKLILLKGMGHTFDDNSKRFSQFLASKMSQFFKLNIEVKEVNYEEFDIQQKYNLE